MGVKGQLWGIVLAAGDGRRLHSLTTDAAGRTVPKQYCSLNGGPSLLRAALDRAQGFTAPDRVVVVVSADHRRWWEPETSHLPSSNVVVQPCNKGTACGVLLPLYHVAMRDEEALVVVLPSDHYLKDEVVLLRALRSAVDAVRKEPSSVVLLGIEPDGPEVEYGWVSPALGRERGVSRVVAFVEKPDRPFAEQLFTRGALWNSFIFVATAGTLVELFDRAMPHVTRSFASTLVVDRSDHRPRDLDRLYDRLPTLDFSRDVLELSPGPLRVLPVPPCGWTDLGSPDRVARCVAELPVDTVSTPATGVGSPLDLARAVARFEHPPEGLQVTANG
jgi:mannose-1-phosphate guanylyltransferase